MNPVEEFLELKAPKEKTAGLLGSAWKGMKFQELMGPEVTETAAKALNTPANRFAHTLGNQLTAGAAISAVGLGGESVLRGMRQLVDMGVDKWRKPIEYKAMLSAHPELMEQDASRVQALYNSLRHMSPHMAKDPVIAGSFVRTLLNQGSEGSVAVPMDTAKMLADTQGKAMSTHRMEPSQFSSYLSKNVVPHGQSEKPKKDTQVST
ncbi:hypothetical protein UFOVP276_61 [uncultured Caudovirales phage]|uniref:Uncharacterized protein n=1 Tax=uncultured Caudovirales phage TaxID=2100421 RepID=A0A6J5LJ36_9CAUD|nr:hypothetical protein UFOVP127_198 [uncultured Caudovirales phage]CAB4135071.1 hypothetical protein UFOVP276_61 [uncultured Caudovirales phage]